MATLTWWLSIQSPCSDHWIELMIPVPHREACLTLRHAILTQDPYLTPPSGYLPVCVAHHTAAGRRDEQACSAYFGY